MWSWICLFYKSVNGEVHQPRSLAASASRSSNVSISLPPRSPPLRRAPLPPGAYSVGDPIKLHDGDLYEIGRSWFIPVDPLFGTTRGHFGIHEDVSSDGTAGCIGLAGRALTEEVTRWVKQVGARYLVVLG